MITRFKLWVKAQWDKNGSKYLFSAAGLAGGWQTMILSGFVQAGSIEKRIVAAIIVWAATHGIGRSLGTAPKSDAKTPAA